MYSQTMFPVLPGFSIHIYIYVYIYPNIPPNIYPHIPKKKKHMEKHFNTARRLGGRAGLLGVSISVRFPSLISSVSFSGLLTDFPRKLPAQELLKNQMENRPFQMEDCLCLPTIGIFKGKFGGVVSGEGKPI